MPRPRIEPTPTHPTPTPQQMRYVLAGYPTGIAVIAAQVDGHVVGISANSFTSVSLDPPLVSVAFDRTSTSWPLLRRAERWGVSVLSDTHASAAGALTRPATRRFDGLDVSVADDGSVHLGGSLARFTVTPHAEIDAGDHVLTLLRVLDLHRDLEQGPLVFYGSALHRLAGQLTPSRSERHA